MTHPRWLDEREQQAWRSLMAMQASLSEYIARQLRTHSGLSSADYQVLVHLVDAPGGALRPFALSDVLQWEKSRLSQHLGRMQKRGLVLRKRCPTDHRGAVVVITERGRDLIEAAAPLHVADVGSALIDHLTPEQLNQLCVLEDQVKTRLAAIAQHR